FEKRVSEIEEHVPADGAHALSLEVARTKADEVNAQKNQSRAHNSAEVSVADIDIHGAADNNRTQKTCNRSDDNGDQSLEYEAVLAFHDRQQSTDSRDYTDFGQLVARATQSVGVRSCLYCVASHKSGRTPAMFPSSACEFPMPGPLLPSAE